MLATYQQKTQEGAYISIHVRVSCGFYNGSISCSAGQYSPWIVLDGCTAALPSPGRSVKTTQGCRRASASKYWYNRTRSSWRSNSAHRRSCWYLPRRRPRRGMHIRTSLTESKMQPAMASFDASPCSPAPAPTPAGPRCSSQRRAKAGERPGLGEESRDTWCPYGARRPPLTLDERRRMRLIGTRLGGAGGKEESIGGGRPWWAWRWRQQGWEATSRRT